MYWAELEGWIQVLLIVVAIIAALRHYKIVDENKRLHEDLHDYKYLKAVNDRVRKLEEKIDEMMKVKDENIHS